MTEISTRTPTITKVGMARIGYAEAPDLLETLLGSCVGIAIWDPLSHQCALAHIVLPDSRGDAKVPGKYADSAVEEMRRQLIERAAHPLRLVAKIAGGATMFGRRTSRDIGRRNCEAVKEELRRHRICLAAEHVGGEKGRVIRLQPIDFTIQITIGRDIVAEI